MSPLQPEQGTPRRWRPQPAWPRPDFLAPGPRRPLLAWALLAVGVLTCALTLTDLLALQQARQRDERELARWQAAAARAAPPERIAAVRPGVDGQARLAKAASQVRQRLAHPWERLFVGVERASPSGVQWLALEHDAERADVRLEGSAPDLAAALQAVDALAAGVGWQDVALRYTGDAGGTSPQAPRAGLRFELAARLDDRTAP